jgi:hypothetical protein
MGIRNEYWAGGLPSNLFRDAARSGRPDDDHIRTQLASTPQCKNRRVASDRLVLRDDSSVAQVSGEFGNCHRRIKPLPRNELARM